MGPKAVACLEMAALSPMDPRRAHLYAEACSRWSEKAIYRKFEDLSDRGYVDYGTSAHLAWLEDKGREALLRAMQVNGDANA